MRRFLAPLPEVRSGDESFLFARPSRAGVSWKADAGNTPFSYVENARPREEADDKALNVQTV